jgi:peptidoglycan/LPS O-acetylase OafA/YrhL
MAGIARILKGQSSKVNPPSHHTSFKSNECWLILQTRLWAGVMAVSPKPIYLSSLQVFRGLAAMSVVVYHACLFTERQSNRVLLGGYYHFGELGVDFFFVLSGFIIAFIHGGELGMPQHAPRYVCRRFFRVYPLLFILTSAKLGLELVAWMRGGAPPDLSRIISSYLLLPAPDGAMPVITAAWTLMHEALFYALFLIALLLGRRASAWILGGWMAVIVLTNAAGASLHGMPRLIFDAHNVEFVFGVIACVLFRSRDRLKISPAWLGISALAVLVLGAYTYNPIGGMDQPLAVRILLGAGFALLILMAGLWEQGPTSITWPKWLCWFGDASYSIYLGHSMLLMAGISAGTKFIPTAEWSGYGVAILSTFFSLAVCGLLWLWVERPLLRWSRRWCQ